MYKQSNPNYSASPNCPDSVDSLYGKVLWNNGITIHTALTRDKTRKILV